MCIRDSLGAARYLPSEIMKQPGHVAFYNDLDVKATVTGIVVSDPDVRDRYTALVLSVERIRIPQMGITKTVEGRILVRASRLIGWRYGDWVHAEGMLETPPEMDGFSYREYLGNQGIHSLMPTAYLKRSASIGPIPSSPSSSTRGHIYTRSSCVSFLNPRLPYYPAYCLVRRAGSPPIFRKPITAQGLPTSSPSPVSISPSWQVYLCPCSEDGLGPNEEVG